MLLSKDNLTDMIDYISVTELKTDALAKALEFTRDHPANAEDVVNTAELFLAFLKGDFDK